eukprot:GHRQ01019026.1.p2 GENE.GHRQ01019026.1~~GHRQ01019026.1.p2  ORF type:complete len:126 (+),score=8.85 GHRQ01019026.1:118-495(+)
MWGCGGSQPSKQSTILPATVVFLVKRSAVSAFRLEPSTKGRLHFDTMCCRGLYQQIAYRRCTTDKTMYYCLRLEKSQHNGVTISTRTCSGRMHHTAGQLKCCCTTRRATSGQADSGGLPPPPSMV